MIRLLRRVRESGFASGGRVCAQAFPGKITRRTTALRQPSRFGAWLAAITRNIAKDYYRRPRLRIEFTDELAAVDASAAPGGLGETRESAEILESVRALPEAYRETLILRLVEGTTGPEIAAKTGLSHGSVRVNLNRGMQQLREKLARRRMPANRSEERAHWKIG